MRALVRPRASRTSRTSAPALAFAALASLLLTGCPKKNKPPKMDRVWLGPSHACGLEKGGGLACWGRNDDGELGDGTTTSRPVVARVVVAGDGAMAGAGFERPDDLLLGRGFTCARAKGRLRCWGKSPLGDAARVIEGVKAAAANDAGLCFTDAGGTRCARATDPELRAADFARGSEVTLLAGGGDRFCARLEPRAVRCSEPGAADVLVGADVVSLTVGEKHACAALRDGSVSCWGDGAEGQLGDGARSTSRVPVVVHDLPFAESVHAGAKHTCARLRGGTLACWGDNRRFQLSNGTTDPSARPLPLPGLHGVQELAVAGDSACARLLDASIRCWGGNDRGQLGDGSTNDVSVPMPIRWAAGAATR